MDLILWRHAEAEDGWNDLERQLTAKGQRQAKKMAKWLKLQLRDKSPYLIASGARRSQQTLAAFSKDFHVDTRLNPGADVVAYLTAHQNQECEQGVVVVVGHQPEIGRVASLLLSGREVEWKVKKGAVWWLQQIQDGNSVRYFLRAMMTPQML